MWRPNMSLVGFCLFCIGAGLGVPAMESRAIEVSPTNVQVEQAVEQGLRAAKDRVLPNRLYTWFGSDQELRPKGFLMTKMNGLAVMASHFGLRGETPSETEIHRILVEETMLVSVTIFGETMTFADNSYLVLKQGAETGEAPQSTIRRGRSADENLAQGSTLQGQGHRLLSI